MRSSTSLRPAAGPGPFLKWAGGKRQLLKDLRRFIPSSFNGYHEPFLGSGALFFDLWGRGELRGRRCRLTDVNTDLIGCYQALSRDVDEVLRYLGALETDHRSNPVAAYYRVRDERFNPHRRRRPGQDASEKYPAELAAMFIYLNRTGYNGLFRLNARGDFNVPVGRYARPTICHESRLRSVAAVLAHANVDVSRDPFDSVAGAASAGDLVYLDPPYVPLTATASFTAYTPGSFSEADQRRLQQVALGLARSGCWVVLSNSTAPLVTELYDSAEARSAGLRACRVSARRSINSQSTGRGDVQEYVISNVPARSASAAS